MYLQHSSGNGHEKSVKENNDLPQSKTVKDSRMVSENPQVELAAESKPCKTNVCCPEKDIKSLVPSESCSRVEEKDDDASLEEGKRFPFSHFDNDKLVYSNVTPCRFKRSLLSCEKSCTSLEF